MTMTCHFNEENEKMEAKEMFKKLGYEYKNYAGYISYEKEINNTTHFISFDNKNHTVTKHQISDRYLSITMKELQAINKQVEELGWNK